MQTAATLPETGERGHIASAPGDPARHECFIPSPCVQNHAANVMPLANGDLGCVWFGGTQEGMADISIYFSRLPKGTDRWTEAVKLSEDATRSEQNPILFPTPEGPLWLIFTAQRSGNQDTAFVRRRVSHDDGMTWGAVETLFAPEPGRGLFVRQPPAVLANGDWLLPVFHCQGVPGRKWVGDLDTSAVKVSSDRGATWREVAVPDSLGCVHMNVVPLADGTLLALYRSRWANSIYESRSLDDGASWSAPVPTALPNNNSSIQATALADGRLALVFNDVNAEGATERRASLYDEIEDEDDAGVPEAAPPAEPGARSAFWGVPRAPMTLALSSDGGRTWIRRNLEVGDGYCMTNNSRDRTNREFSYPSVKQDRDGSLVLAFTYFRQAIKFVRVRPEWVEVAA